MASGSEVSDEIAEALPSSIISATAASHDIDALLDSFELQQMRRYFHQVHWRKESVRASIADAVERGLTLESVAAHSWHVADASIMIAVHFPYLSVDKVSTAAILHDKLEIYTGDFDPVGSDGKGARSHAFNEGARKEKAEAELDALASYLARLNPAAAKVQEGVLKDVIFDKTPEARFVKAIDKLQALGFVHLKKRGNVTPEHFSFTIRYSAKCVAYFPPLSRHYAVLLQRFVDAVSRRRGTDQGSVAASILRAEATGA